MVMPSSSATALRLRWRRRRRTIDDRRRRSTTTDDRRRRRSTTTTDQRRPTINTDRRRPTTIDRRRRSTTTRIDDRGRRRRRRRRRRSTVDDDDDNRRRRRGGGKTDFTCHAIATCSNTLHDMYSVTQHDVSCRAYITEPSKSQHIVASHLVALRRKTLPSRKQATFTGQCAAEKCHVMDNSPVTY